MRNKQKMEEIVEFETEILDVMEHVIQRRIEASFEPLERLSPPGTHTYLAWARGWLDGTDRTQETANAVFGELLDHYAAPGEESHFPLPVMALAGARGAFEDGSLRAKLCLLGAVTYVAEAPRYDNVVEFLSTFLDGEALS